MIVGHLSVRNDNGVTYADLDAAITALKLNAEIEPNPDGRIAVNGLTGSGFPLSVNVVELPYRSRIDERS